MPDDDAPVLLELAPLAREQIGPFFLLGVEKDADRELIESRWAERVIRARKNQLGVPLPDVHWARETLTDAERRVRADAASLNADTHEGVLRRLSERYGAAGPSWKPLDVETSLIDYTPNTDIPDPAAVHQSVQPPPVPREFPVVATILEQFVHEPLDPWSLELPANE